MDLPHPPSIKNVITKVLQSRLFGTTIIDTLEALQSNHGILIAQITLTMMHLSSHLIVTRSLHAKMQAKLCMVYLAMDHYLDTMQTT